MGIQLINQSKLITDEEVVAIAHAVRTQLEEHLAPTWRISPMSCSTFHHPTWYPFYLKDDVAEAPGAIAYHDVGTDGKPFGNIGVGTALKAGITVSSAISHEAVELAVDRYCQLWAASNTLNALIAYESADPVENDSYMIDGIEVSNFVTPWWFVEDGISHQYDWMHKLSKPYTMSRGGYLIKMAEGKVTQQFGEDGGAAYTARQDSHGRTFWRQAQGYRQLLALAA